MSPVSHVEAELKLPDAEVNVLSTSQWPETIDATYTSERHLFAMYLSPMLGSKGRYFEAGDKQDFSTVGSVFFRPANLHLNIRKDNKSSPTVRAVHCTIDDGRLQALNVASIDWSDQTLQATLNIRAAHQKSYFLRVMNEILHPTFASPVVVDALLTIMVNDLMGYLAPQEAKQPASYLAADGMVRMIRERVCEVYSVTPTVSELAKLCGVSERHLLRLFREREGMSLIEFIRQARLQKSMELLSGSTYRLKEIAYRLGFQSHASFTTAFGREMGMGPAQYRRAHRRTYFPSKPS